MAIGSSGYFNNPQFAQAASNLASLFAPPSGSDAAGWAAANAKKEEASRLAQLFTMAQQEQFNKEQFDRMGAAAGQWTPNQSYYAVDQGNAVTMRGQDVSAATSRANNAADNQRSMLGALYQPLNPGQIRPELPGSLASQYGMPSVTVPQTAGAPKPLTESEFNAAVLGTLPESEQRAAALGSTPVQTIVTPEGPRISFQSDAVGKEPFINKGAEPKPDITNYRTPDGAVGTAVYDAARGGLVDTQSGAPLPQGTQTFKAQAQGAVGDVLGKATSNQVDGQLLDIAVAKNTAVKLRDLIAKSPSSQGAVGWLRGTAQNLVQTGGELGQYFGGGVNDVQKAIANGLADEDLAGAFDPNIPAIEMMANLLAFQYAKTTTGERLSNEMLRATRSALGLDGLTSNQASSLARLNQAIQLIEDQERILGEARAGGVKAVGQPAPAAPPPQGMPSAPPTVRRYNPQTGRIE